MPKTAFITGITGQDGSYLAELLLSKGYQVLGLVRRLSSPNMGRIAHIVNRVTLIEGDLMDQSSLVAALQMAQPDEIYNLAAQSFVGASWNQPILAAEVTGSGALRLFDAARQTCRNAKIYHASTSEMFGKTDEFPQTEKTRFHPVSPYACAKVFAHHSAINYRESYGMFVCCGILFNHESPRRGIEFVTRKITDGVAKISKGLAKELRLGNLEAQRDWGFAGAYVKTMWLMHQQDQPDEYVLLRVRPTPWPNLQTLPLNRWVWTGETTQLSTSGLNARSTLSAWPEMLLRLGRGCLGDPR
jgi:GDPmannose 4,6-dehydratase